MAEPEVDTGGTGSGLEEIQRRRRRYLLVGLGVMVLVCAGGVTLLPRYGQSVGIWLFDEFIQPGWREADVQSTIVKGDEIRSALAAHYADHGSYPSTLDGLVPAYLPEVPVPDTGLKVWSYRIWRGGEGYELGFAANESRYPEASTDERTPGWFRNE